jgi:hypothetical protein
MLTEYSVPYWVDAFFTGLAIGLGLPSVFHKATQAVSRVGSYTPTVGAYKIEQG